MEKMIIISIAIVLLAVLIIRSIKGSNFTLIARNVAGIYEAVNNCSSAKDFNESQKYFLSIVFDMMTYVKQGKIKLDEIESMTKIVALESGDDTLQNISRLSREVILKVFALEGKADMDATKQAVEKKESIICNAVKKELDAGPEGKICRKWIPLVEQFIENRSFEDNFDRLS